MEDGNRIGQFLRARRERLQPEDVGIESWGRRRVPGLRREELAMLAGVSYYVRLEQGRERHPSEQVLEALARALQRLIESRSHTPAPVLGRCLDVLAANRPADALYGGELGGRNLIRSVFLDPGIHGFYADWEGVAQDTVATLRASAGADLDHQPLTELVGELSLKSEAFRRLWARHDVREKSTGTKRFVHPIVGELSLAYEAFAIGGVPGQVLVVSHAEPASPDERALALLASLAASDSAASPARS